MQHPKSSGSLHALSNYKAPSSITPIPMAPVSKGTARGLGIAGIVASSISALGGMIAAAGGVPEVVKWLAKALEHGWPAGVGLLAISSWLIHLNQLAETRAERITMDLRQADRDERVIAVVNKLIDHAASEDMAHQRTEAFIASLTTVLSELRATIAGIAIVQEPTSPSHLYPSGESKHPSATTLPPVPPRHPAKL